MGSTAFRMLADLHYPTELDTISFDLIKDLEAQYGTKSSRSAARVQFARVSQHEGQTIDEFIAELRKASQECEFGMQLEDRLRDQLLVGIRSDAIRKRLLEHERDSLSDVTKRARDMELIERDNKMTLTHTPVNRVGYRSSNVSEETTYQSNRNKLNQPPSLLTRESGFESKCYRCGLINHTPQECFYYVKALKCNNCQRVGHKASMCRFWKKSATEQTFKNSFNSSRTFQKSSEAKLVSTGNPESEGETVSTVNAVLGSSSYKVKVKIDNNEIELEIDTGSLYTLLPRSVWFVLGRPRLQSGPILRDYNGNHITVE